MKRTTITLTLAAIFALTISTTETNAQNLKPLQFESQTHAIPGVNYGGTYRDAQRAIGPPARRTIQGNQDRYSTIFNQQARQSRNVYAGNQGWPMRDYLPATNYQNFNQRRNYNYYQPRNYNYYQPQYNTQQLQKSIQDFSRAVQQLRQQRNQYNNGYRRW